MYGLHYADRNEKEDDRTIRNDDQFVTHNYVIQELKRQVFFILQPEKNIQISNLNKNQYRK